jgi:hypothetical protein
MGVEMENELFRWFAGLFRQENEGPVYVGRHFIPMPDPSEWPDPAVNAKCATLKDNLTTN